jgi:hypothetical protein
VWDVAISADGVLAATASDDLTVRVWELLGNSCRHVLEGHSGWVVALAFAGDKCVPRLQQHCQSILEQGQNHPNRPLAGASYQPCLIMAAPTAHAGHLLAQRAFVHQNGLC